MKIIIAILLVAAFVASLSGCDNIVEPGDLPNTFTDTSASHTPPPNQPSDSSFAVTKAANLMEGFSPNIVHGKPADTAFIASMADFSIELFKETVADKENSLISPLSVMLALSMTANGANNETLAQIESLLGNGISLDDLNEYLYGYVKGLPSKDKSKINIANSIWFRDYGSQLWVEQNFLQKNADYYGAEIYKSAFNDETLNEINDWVKLNTDGMIDKILEEINPSTVMYLINAVAFDAEWESIYSMNNILEGVFTDINGKMQSVDFMKSEEYKYLDDGNATGFIKPYANSQYSFVALLPNKGISVEKYIKTLTGTELIKTISNAADATVDTSMLKFSYDYVIKMNDALIALGMPDAFDDNMADFSRIDSSVSYGNNIFIDEVLHKTFISVDELGTKAGAVTKVEMRMGGIPRYDKTVVLDRPFVYAIIDNVTGLPVFIGAVMMVR